MLYFSHPAAFGFQASLPPDNITLNLASKKTDQSLSDFQTDIGAAAHTTLEQLISHTRGTLVDIIASLQDSDRGYCSFTSAAHILEYLFKSASRQNHEVCASQFPFVLNFRTVGHIVRPEFVVALAGLWLRLSNNVPLAHASLQAL